ncbi:MAG: stage II sporulation protein M [Gemmatimonadaceae bacterium]
MSERQHGRQPSLPTLPLDQLVEIETPEQVAFSYTVAGVGTRAAAAVVDHLICIGIAVALFLVGAFVMGIVAPGAVLGKEVETVGAWVLGIMAIAQVAVFWGYYVIFEGLWDGQTPGKRRQGIRVVQDGGYSTSFAASAVRNLVRALDMQPLGTYAVGIVSAAISKSGKRLGDMVAGTMVVQERIVTVASDLPTGSAAASQAQPSLAAVLTEDEYALLDRFIARRNVLDPDRRRAIADELSRRFESHLQHDTGQPSAKLVRLFESEKAARVRGVAARGATGAARERHAIVAQGASRWSGFAKILARVKMHGLRGVSEQEVSEFVSQYREVATDLARLQTASRDRDTDALFYVSRLVGAGHNLLYRQKALDLAGVWRYLTVTVPREIRSSVSPIALSGALFFLPLFLVYGAVRADPGAGEEILGLAMIDRIEEGIVRARSGTGGYIKIEDVERPLMAGSIIANNVSATYTVFASGITAGILTVLILVMNGVSIGSVVGLYASRGVTHLVLEFVAPHGVLELTALTIAGGGALHIASAILLPGALTRREALVVRGRRAIRLIAAATIFLLVAGAIEGLISPRDDLSASWKYGVSLFTAVLVLLYITLGRGIRDGEGKEEFAYSDERALTARY